MKQREREYVYEKERERVSGGRTVCWLGARHWSLASWQHADWGFLDSVLKNNHLHRVCVCVCVWENIYLSGCTWATVTNYFPLTLSFIMKYTNCLHVFSQAKHTPHTHIFTVTACNVPSQAWLPPPAGTSKVIPSLLLWANSLALLFSHTQTYCADLPNTLTRTQNIKS